MELKLRISQKNDSNGTSDKMRNMPPSRKDRRNPSKLVRVDCSFKWSRGENRYYLRQVCVAIGHGLFACITANAASSDIRVDADYHLLPLAPLFFCCQDGLNCTTHILQLGDAAKSLQVRKRISAVVGMCSVSRAYMKRISDLPRNTA
jgi:hypothetical protein